MIGHWSWLQCLQIHGYAWHNEASRKARYIGIGICVYRQNFLLHFATDDDVQKKINIHLPRVKFSDAAKRNPNPRSSDLQPNPVTKLCIPFVTDVYYRNWCSLDISFCALQPCDGRPFYGWRSTIFQVFMQQSSFHNIFWSLSKYNDVLQTIIFSTFVFVWTPLYCVLQNIFPPKIRRQL